MAAVRYAIAQHYVWIVDHMTHCTSCYDLLACICFVSLQQHRGIQVCTWLFSCQLALYASAKPLVLLKGVSEYIALWTKQITDFREQSRRVPNTRYEIIMTDFEETPTPDLGIKQMPYVSNIPSMCSVANSCSNNSLQMHEALRGPLLTTFMDVADCRCTQINISSNLLSVMFVHIGPKQLFHLLRPVFHHRLICCD